MPFVEVFVDTPLAECEALRPQGPVQAGPRGRDQGLHRHRRSVRATGAPRAPPRSERRRSHRGRDHRRPDPVNDERAREVLLARARGDPHGDPRRRHRGRSRPRTPAAAPRCVAVRVKARHRPPPTTPTAPLPTAGHHDATTVPIVATTTTTRPVASATGTTTVPRPVFGLKPGPSAGTPPIRRAPAAAGHRARPSRRARGPTARCDANGTATNNTGEDDNFAITAVWVSNGVQARRGDRLLRHRERPDHPLVVPDRERSARHRLQLRGRGVRQLLPQTRLVLGGASRRRRRGRRRR